MTHQNGATNALMLLAYDLYTVENNSTLPPILLSRLRKDDQFQGARYELFCISALLRGGFSINYEDESDPPTSHLELVAAHLPLSTIR